MEGGAMGVYAPLMGSEGVFIEYWRFKTKQVIIN